MPDFYGTVAEADMYHQERGNVAWAALDTGEKESAMLIASEYLDTTYECLFSGYRTGRREQVRAWPRTNAWIKEIGYPAQLFPSTEIPVEAERATYELALREATNPGVLTADFTASDGIKRAAVQGAVSVEFHGDGSFEASRPQFVVVDKILAPLLTGDGAGFSSLSGRRVRV